MAIKLNDLSAMLDEHFRLAPPIDSKNTPVSGEIREFGTGISLGDGTSMADVRGLENIQVTEKANRFDKVKQISMKDWLQKTISENPNPEAVAASVQKLLKHGRVTYFEQGREFATRLSLDAKTKKFSETAVNREAPLVKPTLTFRQKWQRFWKTLPENELKAYNRELLSYELQKKSIDTSKARVPVGARIVPLHHDGKGRILASAGHMAKVSENIGLHHEISQLSPEVQSEVLQDILAGEKAREVLELKIGPTLNEEKFLAARYPNGKPDGINTIDDHIKSKIKLQDSFSYVRIMKMPDLSAMASKGGPHAQSVVGDCFLELTRGAGFIAHDSSVLSRTQAFKSMFDKPEVALKQIRGGQIFDQYIRNLEKYPNDFFKPKELEKLLNVCIEPHPKLQTAMEAAKNPDLLKVANNNQAEKQLQKQIEKKPSVPKMG